MCVRNNEQLSSAHVGEKMIRSLARLFVVPTLFCSFGFAQNAWTPKEINDMRDIRDAALSSDYGYQELSYLTDSIGPRLTGSAQYNAAADYVAAEMRKLGLEVTLEKATVPHWVRRNESGELVTYPGQANHFPQKIVLTALGHSVGTPADGVTAEVVVVNNSDELHALGDKVQGKIVLFNAKYDDRLRDAGYSFDAYGDAVRYRGIGPAEAAKLGAVGALVRSVGSADYRLPHTGLTLVDPKGKNVPAAAVSAEDADLLARLTKRGPVQMKLVLNTEMLEPVTGYNVIADLKGSEHPDEYVIVSGHLDSWDLGTGAIDDGAGVAIAMQAVETIHRLNLHPKRTIRFVAWVDEEGGISGALQYAKDYPAAKHFGTIESDTGAGHPIGYITDSSDEAFKVLAPIAPLLEEMGVVVNRTGEEAGADISPLSWAGVPGFAPLMDSRKYFDYHHTAADTLDKVDPKELRENGALVGVLAYGLANCAKTLPRIAKPVPDWMK
ncbi:peptidase M28 [Candidatus Koribacter versatilis Ellin345]|uniref:Carboxypeptidase Q n=2 Tax=Candidatus Korobacter versatilis TaxID=658062 RepID=Q1IRY6_KORVE|nr:peptidase M28 [Candidatus Koribacter versatilis Ellin345]